MLNKSNTGLIIVDVQGKLASIVHESEEVIENLITLIKGAEILDLPIIWLEQYPKGLGPTIDVIKNQLKGQLTIEKMTFSAYKNKAFKQALEETDCTSFLLRGTESPVCVYQTGADLLASNHSIEAIEDDVSSRTKKNKEIGIKDLNSLGANATTIEMSSFELMETADYPHLKKISSLTKSFTLTRLNTLV